MPPDTLSPSPDPADSPVALEKKAQGISFLTELFQAHPQTLKIALFLFQHIGTTLNREFILQTLELSRMNDKNFQVHMARIATELHRRKNGGITFITYDLRPPRYGMSYRRGYRLPPNHNDQAAIDATNRDVRESVIVAFSEDPSESTRDAKEKESLARKEWVNSFTYKRFPDGPLPHLFDPERQMRNHMIRVCLEYLEKHIGEKVSSEDLYRVVTASFRKIRVPPGIRYEWYLNIRDLMREAREHTDTSQTTGFGIAADVSGNNYVFDHIKNIQRLLAFGHTAVAERSARWSNVSDSPFDRARP